MIADLFMLFVPLLLLLRAIIFYRGDRSCLSLLSFYLIGGIYAGLLIAYPSLRPGRPDWLQVAATAIVAIAFSVALTDLGQRTSDFLGR